MALTWSDLGWLLSPTRKIIDRWKSAGGSKHRGDALRKWSKWLFFSELFALAVLCTFFHDPAPQAWTFIGVLLLFYSCSRINEIAYAFYRDPLSPAKESNLSFVDRVRMAMRSYFSLGFNFSILYYFAPIVGLFRIDEVRPLSSFTESVYFSGVTLATLGYGDIVPVHFASRAAALAEVTLGILVVAVAIASYISSIREPDADDV